MRIDPKGPNTLQLVIGSDDWPFPIPLAKHEQGLALRQTRTAPTAAGSP